MSSRTNNRTRNKRGKKKGNKGTRTNKGGNTQSNTIDDYLHDSLFPISHDEYITIELEMCKEDTENPKYNYKVSSIKKHTFTKGEPDYSEYSPLKLETLQKGINEFNLKDPNSFIRLRLISGTDGLKNYKLENLKYEKDTDNKEKCGYGTPIYEELIPMASGDAISTVPISPVETIQGNAESSVDLPIQNTVTPKPISYENTVSDFVNHTMNNMNLTPKERNNMIEDKMLEVVLYLLTKIDYTKDLKEEWFGLLEQFKDIFLFEIYEKNFDYSPNLQNIFSCTNENWPDKTDDQKERLVNVGECVKILQAMKLIERFDTSSTDKFNKLNEIYAIIEDNNLLDTTSSNNNFVIQLKTASDLVHTSDPNAKSKLLLINPILQAKLNEVNKCMDVSNTELDELDFDEESIESEDEEGQDIWSDTGSEIFGLESNPEGDDDELIKSVEDANTQAETVLAKDDSSIKKEPTNPNQLFRSNSVPNIKMNNPVENSKYKSIVNDIILNIDKSNNFPGKGKDIFIQNVGVDINKLLQNPNIKDRKELRDIQFHLSNYLQHRDSTPEKITHYLDRAKTHLTNIYGGNTKKHTKKRKQRKNSRNRGTRKGKIQRKK